LALFLAVRPNKIQVSDAKRASELMQAEDRRVSLTAFEAAKILLTEAGTLFDLLLGKPLLAPDTRKIPSN
jgi:hypothetical protein